MAGLALSIDSKALDRAIRELKNGDRALSRRLLSAGTFRKAAHIVEKEWRLQVTGQGTARKLGVRTGDFRRRIRVRETAPGRAIVGTDHPGAAIHEYGGVIVPRRAPALVFEVAPGKWVRTQRVVMPQRPHRKPAVEAAQPKVSAFFEREAIKAVEELAGKVGRRG